MARLAAFAVPDPHPLAVGGGAERQALQGGSAFLAEDHRAGAGELEAVRQHLATLLVVEHAGDGAELDRGGDAGKCLRPVLHEDGDGLARGHALLAQHRGDAVRPDVEFGVGPAPVLELQGDALGMLRGLALQQQADGAGLVGVGERQAQQAAIDGEAVAKARERAARDVAQADPLAVAHR